MLIYWLILFAIFAPFLVWLKWHSMSKVTYEGRANLMGFPYPFPRERRYAQLMIPGRASRFLAVANPPRQFANTWHKTVHVRELKRPFQRARVDTIRWDDNNVEAIDEFMPTEGIAIGTFYLVAGVVIAMLSKEFSLGTTGFLLCALSLVMSGLCVNLFRVQNGIVRHRAFSILAVVMKTKPIFWFFAACALTVATVLVFALPPGLLMLIPGLNCALELGGLCALLINWAFGKIE